MLVSRSILFPLLFLLVILLTSGCDSLISPQERRGYSPLPQSRPASWESSGLSGN